MSRINSILFILLIISQNIKCSELKRQLDEYTLTFDNTNWSYDVMIQQMVYIIK